MFAFSAFRVKNNVRANFFKARDPPISSPLESSPDVSKEILLVTDNSSSKKSSKEPVLLDNSSQRDDMDNASTNKVPPSLPPSFVPLLPAVVDNVEKFVFFIGYPRSGHSIIGSFMDSHPNMIIAHEYPLFKNLARQRVSKYEIFNELYKSSFDQLVSGWRGKKNVVSKGYSLAIDGLWQASFDRLKVIGDKHGGSTVQWYRQYPEMFHSVLDYLKLIINIPIYIIHVVRNPFDMIATQTLYVNTGIAGTRTNASEENKFNNTDLLTNTALDMLGRAEAVTELIETLKLPVLEIHNEDFISDPVHAMKSICTFVEVECSSHYLQVCKNNTFSSASQSRNYVVWPQTLIALISDKLEKFPFFKRYSFFN